MRYGILLKTGIVSVAYHTGLLHLRASLRNRAGFHVLMYHHVPAEPDPFSPHITAEAFSRQIEFLQRNFRLFPLEELARKAAAGEEIPPRSAALTFDDEYEDIYRNAFPFLKKHGIPATVFIATGFVDTDRVPWTDELGFLLKMTEKETIEFEAEGDHVRFELHGVALRLRALREIKKRLKPMVEARRREAYAEIKNRLAVTAENLNRILTSAQIKEMAASGIAFGAHTVNHPILTRVKSDEARREIQDSKNQLEAIMQRQVAGFCYPNGEEGDFNTKIKDMVRQADFSYACTSLEGANGPEVDVYELKRKWTSEPSLPLFALRVWR